MRGRGTSPARFFQYVSADGFFTHGALKADRLCPPPIRAAGLPARRPALEKLERLIEHVVGNESNRYPDILAEDDHE